MNQPKDQGAAVGIDFGGTTIKCAVVREGKIVERGRVIDTRAAGSADETIAVMAQEVMRLKPHGVKAVGIGLPGLVDAEKGLVHRLSNVPGWDGVSLGPKLEQLTGMPVICDNDANAMAFGECTYGAGSGWKNVVFVTLGTGVGGGIVLNGELYRGSQFCSGEIGQASIDFDGIPGEYGNLGALDKYVGNQQILARAAAMYAEAGIQKDMADITLPALDIAADNGDPVAIKIWADTGLYIGAAIANVLWLLNPSAIVIGGGVAKAGERLFSAIRQAIAARTSEVLWKNLELLPAQLGTDAGMIGCAALALHSAEFGDDKPAL